MQTLLPPSPALHVAASGHAARYAYRLLTDLGATTAPPVRGALPDCDPRWRECGLAELTGEPDAPGLDCPVPLAAYADGVAAAFAALSPRPLPAAPRGADLLSQRARLAGLSRRGAISPNGSCRILPCADGQLAVNLPRDSDWELVPAWLGAPAGADWDSLAAALRSQPAGTLLARGRLLGLAVAESDPPPAPLCKWLHVQPVGVRVAPPARPPRVVDLSALWAGPLCSRLLAWAGADVTRVECSSRPDGARSGEPAFFSFLNDGKRQVTLDLRSDAGRRALRALLTHADIVIEGSRPRALRQMGIVAEELLREVPGLTWLSITAHGRDAPAGDWVGFGDDAAVAAGLSAVLHRATGRWLICGDAIADPFTGLHAALAAQAAWLAGGGQLLSLSLAGTVRHAIAFAGQAAP